ncbi:GNAT family N-acetyltransferase [Salipiger mucosus]|uniref:N-acetyltransferase domain-containing protein n=1 Tax=Salipiger mucosus DSM 16094 TaxID=1123237 RepID=S9R0E0_9RHOB|nr:GNAT family N-acetyltransferase [Salipiger mucosus]EPX85403.1 hypothetical protein Salmuc_02784 [Salipiger mucosus DSM 16094]
MIVTCTEDDLPDLARMLRPAADRLPGQVCGMTEPGALCDVLSCEMRGGARVLGYRAGGALRGCLIAWPREAVDVLAGRHYVWVAPTWRHRGIARRLVAACEPVPRAGLPKERARG